MRILGIDPGTRFVGYAVINAVNNHISLIKADIIKIPAKFAHPRKLLYLYENLNEIIEEHKPDTAAVEDIFISKNIQGAFKIGQARGVILLALAQKSISIAEYAPREVKSAVTGNGNASKTQVAYMVRTFFPQITEDALNDVTDAAAVSFCHFNRIRFNQL